MKILIVEDASFLSEMVKEVLTKAGHHIVGVAEDGKQAVDMANYYRPDLILMDLVLPGMSGIEATQKIIETQPEARIVAFSTLDDETIMQQALEAGCCNFLPKPFKKQELMAIVERAGVKS